MRVFLSSTCYDLPDLRARIERFLKVKGHTPLLSDRSAFSIDPGIHRHDTCIAQASQSDLLIMIVDKRFGAKYYKDNMISITWAEMRAALSNNVDCLAFVRRAVFDERKTWKLNNENIKPAHCDNALTFRLIDEIQAHERGVWCQPFDNVEDVIDQLSEIGQIKTGKLADIPVLSRRKRSHISTLNLSSPTRKFVHKCIRKPETENKQYWLDKTQIQTCLHLLQSECLPARIAVDTDILPYRTGSLVIDHPVRPADNDGLTWYVERGLSAEGAAVRAELTNIIMLMG